MRTAIATVAVLLYLAAVSARWPAPAIAQSTEPRSPSPESLLNQYCMGCHSDRVKSGGLALSALNLDAPSANPQSAEIAEKVIRKLRGGLMPPGTARRPDAHTTAEFVTWLENKIDTAS